MVLALPAGNMEVIVVFENSTVTQAEPQMT